MASVVRSDLDRRALIPALEAGVVATVATATLSLTTRPAPEGSFVKTFTPVADLALRIVPVDIAKNTFVADTGRPASLGGEWSARDVVDTDIVAFCPLHSS